MADLPAEISDALRTHVFDRMPIRLLKISQSNSSLRPFEIVDRIGTLNHIREKIGTISTTTFDEMVEEKRKSNPGASRFDLTRPIILDLISKHAQYAILSHTWLQDGSEVTFQDYEDPARFNAIQDPQGEGYKKLEKFCQVTQHEYGMTLAWMDTICINKESSSELDESLRSMFNWYQFSTVCIVGLTETLTISDMETDRWFTRGWTLQELLAPTKIKFYNKLWVPLSNDENDKRSGIIFPQKARPIEGMVQKITGIEPERLFFYSGAVDIAPISERMTWAAKRRTTRGEDIAYCLMGLFAVSIPISYGEGVERAFFRLLEAILSSHEDALDILNWGGKPVARQFHTSRLIPSSPYCYLHAVDFRTDVQKSALMPEERTKYLPLKPMILTHLGLRVRLLLVPTQLVWPISAERTRQASYDVKMKCLGPVWDNNPVDFSITMYDTDNYGDIPIPTYATNVWTYFHPYRASKSEVTLTYFGLHMFNESSRVLELPRQLTAICLKTIIPSSENGVFSLDDLSPRFIKWDSVVSTASPIIIKVNEDFTGGTFNKKCLIIEKLKLADYGMKLQTLYL